MKYSDLLFNDDAVSGCIPYNVFEDVRLTELFPREVLEIMSKLPSSADIKARQKVFSYLEKEEAILDLQKVYDALYNIKEVFLIYNSLKTDVEKQFIFCTLLYRIISFEVLCSNLFSDDSFLSRFSDIFLCRTKESGFNEMQRAANEAYSSLCTFFTMNIGEKVIKLSSKHSDGYLSRIRKCAVNMGIKLSDTDMIPTRISPELANAISRVSPESWDKLSELYLRYRDYPNEDILCYLEPIHFYLCCSKLARRLSEIGIPYCYARITNEKKIAVTDGFDVTLLAKDCKDIIPNDIFFDENLPFFFLTGANGGGKTTYLRTCVVNLILALNGAPVPCRSAIVCTFDSLLSHFPRDERFESEGRFFDEQKRVDELISNIGKNTFVVLNETYSTTTKGKAFEMTLSLAETLKEKGVFGIYVTHEKGIINSDIPILSCKIDETDSNRRTYKIVRVSSSESSFAEDILKKYFLDKNSLEERFGELD